MNQTAETDLLSIQKSISDFKFQIQKHTKEQLRKVHLIVGFTGEGKSTLLNYIVGNPLISQKPKNKPFIIKAINEHPQIKIGLTKCSTTTTPNLFIDQNTKTTYWDCPGFNDNKGPLQNIKNAYYMWEILRHCNQLKLIIVVSENSLLQGRAVNFIRVLKEIQNMFGEVDKMGQGVTMVVTQTRQVENDQGIREHLRELMNQLCEQQNSLSDKQRKLVDYLSSQKSSILLFPCPTKQGPIEQQLAQRIRISIRTSLTFVPHQKRATLLLAPQLKFYLSQLAIALNIQIQRICHQSNQHMTQKFFSILTQCQSYESFKQQVSNIIRSLEPMSQAMDENQFMANWIKVVNTYDLKLEIQKVYNLKNLIRFIRSASEKVEFSLEKWQKQFQVFYYYSRVNNQPEVTFNNHDSTLTIKAHLLGIKLIREVIERYHHNSIKLIAIQCYDTLFLDQDLNTPGISLLVIAQTWKVIGNININLKGANGEQYLEPAQENQGFNEEGNGFDGINGLPGRPGQPGGSFFGKLISKNGTFGPGILTVDVRGGNGGKGQSGGKGAQGKRGQNSNQMQQIWEKNQQFLVSRVPYKWEDKNTLEKINQVWKTVGTFNAQMLETYRAIGSQGCKGGNGGQGGIGGLPGLSGTVKLQGFKAQVIEGEGERGKDGASGMAGQGGENGYKYEGEYINETVFTAFRTQHKKMAEGQQQQLYPDLEQKVQQKTEQKSAQALKIAARIVVPQVAQQVAQQAAQKAAQQAARQAAILAAQKLAQQSAWQTTLGFASSASHQVASQFTRFVQAGQSLFWPTLQQSAKNTVISATQSSTLSMVTGGVASLGLSLGIQAGVSIASSIISSGWKIEPSLQPNGRGQSGSSPQTCNSEGLLKPQPTYTIDDQKIQRLESEFLNTKHKY